MITLVSVSQLILYQNIRLLPPGESILIIVSLNSLRVAPVGLPLQKKFKWGKEVNRALLDVLLNNAYRINGSN